MKAYWKDLTKEPINKNKRLLVVEMETQEEHERFHDNGNAVMTAYHIHEGEEDTAFGGVGIIFDEGMDNKENKAEELILAGAV